MQENTLQRYKMNRALRTRIKWLIYPGVNLHARLRYRRLPGFFRQSEGNTRHRVLDAGSGNGMLSYRAWQRGGQIIGASLKGEEAAGCRELFNRYRGIPEGALRFVERNLYDLDFPAEFFDEIICAEVLEHLKRDEEICRIFWRWLKPGGVLHLCAPNADHPYNAGFPLDPGEKGGHVRAGYTLEGYRALLGPIGFAIMETTGLGGPIRQAFNHRIIEAQARFGAAAGLPLFLLSLPFLAFESGRREREMPFSIYVKAIKR